MSTRGAIDVPRQGVIPEQDQEQYSAMPHSLRRVLTPPQEDDEDASRQRSVLFESTFFPFSSSLPSPQKWPLAPDNSAHSGLSRARQSVSSIASGSTVQTRTVPVKSILTRHDSGISMATTAKARRTKKRSTPSVKFVDAPTVHYERSEYFTPPSSPPCSPTSSSAPKLTSARWWMKWWKKSSGPPPRPTISGPYHLSHTASLVDLHAARNRKPKPGKLKRLWIRLTDAIG
ncbi:hypothetical protein ID866_375 [Astraeus odoratus]|nr:hypothetical protein ID866_375 [Astraeus odoratus]